LLSESKFVNDEIRRFQKDLMESQKFLLVSLYRQILEKLEGDLESGDRERQLQGVDRIIELWNLANSDGEFRRRFGL
jgi:hypothetical protein